MSIDNSVDKADSNLAKQDGIFYIMLEDAAARFNVSEDLLLDRCAKGELKLYVDLLGCEKTVSEWIKIIHHQDGTKIKRTSKFCYKSKIQLSTEHCELLRKQDSIKVEYLAEDVYGKGVALYPTTKKIPEIYELVSDDMYLGELFYHDYDDIIDTDFVINRSDVCLDVDAIEYEIIKIKSEEKLAKIVAEELLRLDKKINDISKQTFKDFDRSRMVAEASRNIYLGDIASQKGEDHHFESEYLDTLDKINCAFAAFSFDLAEKHAESKNYEKAISKMCEASYFLGVAVACN